MTTRQCENCGKFALVPDEIKPKGHKCAECIRQSRLAYNRAYHPAYYKRNRKQVLKRAKRYRRKNHARILERQREYAAQPENRERQRERSRRWYQDNKERHAARVAAWQAEHRDLQREYQRANYMRTKLNPKDWARYLEDSRMRERLLAERRGTPIPPLSEREYIERYGTGFGAATRVPAAPLEPLVHDGIALWGEEAFARRAGVSPKRFRDVLEGVELVSLVTADRICMSFGFPMSMLYQDVGA